MSKTSRTGGDASQQLIMVGESSVPLPEGVTVSQWALEKMRWQNPRIRTYLGCFRLLDSILESNYAILHCSPDRLLEIWRRMVEISKLIEQQLAPLLASASVIPELDGARLSCRNACDLLARTVLADLKQYPEEYIRDTDILEVRKLLCVSIGKVHSFLQDTFGELIASDARSLHSADYFLSKRFPRDVDEAEWLHHTVGLLNHYLDELDELRSDLPNPGALPDALVDDAEGELETELRRYLERLVSELTPNLKQVLALRGIRFQEMEVLDRYAMTIPSNCEVLVELIELLHVVTPDPASGRAENRIRQRITELIADNDHAVRDLMAFIPLWLENIEQRRALLLKRSAATE